MTDSAKKATPSRRRFQKSWLVVGVVILFVVFVRVRLLSMPLERDEGEYAYAGQLMLQGIPPYKLAYNMKLPGIYAAYAAIMAVFGETIEGIHIGLIIVNVTCIILMFLLGRKLFDPNVGAVAAATYGVVSLSPGVLGLAAHATQFVVVFMLAAMLCLLRAVERGRRPAWFASGCLFGVAFLMKQHGVFFGIFGGAWLVWTELQARPVNWRRLAERAGLYGAGCVLPFAVVCLLLWRAGVFATFWFWTFVYAQKYITAVPLAEGLSLLRGTIGNLAGPHWPLAALAVAGMFLLWWKRRARHCDLLVTGFFICSVAAICPGLYFREHYYVLLLPTFSLLVGIGGAFLVPAAQRAGPPVLKHGVRAGVTAIALAFAVWDQRTDFFMLTPRQTARDIYGANPFPECVVIARYIRDHSDANASVMVFGSEPEIYFYAHRHSASGFIYMYDLVKNQPYALEMQKLLIREVEAAKPEFFVLVSVSSSGLPNAHSATLLFDWGAPYCQEYYDMVGGADIVSADETDYVWGNTAADYHFLSPSQIWVFKRKPGR